MVVWEEVAIPARVMTNSKACPIGLSYGQLGRLQHIWFMFAYTDANRCLPKRRSEILELDCRFVLYADVPVQKTNSSRCCSARTSRQIIFCRCGKVEQSTTNRLLI